MLSIARSMSRTLSSRRRCRSAPEKHAPANARTISSASRPDDARADAEDVHVVVLDALVGRERVVAGGRTHARHLIRRHAGADATAAEEHAAVVPRRQWPRHRLGEVGIVDRVRRLRAEVAASCPRPRAPLTACLERKARMVGADGVAHGSGFLCAHDAAPPRPRLRREANSRYSSAAGADAPKRSSPTDPP